MTGQIEGLVGGGDKGDFSIGAQRSRKPDSPSLT
jgi:hypothetical protein